MRLCAASRPVSSLPLSSSTSPGFQLATSSGVIVSRFTRRALCGVVGQLRPVFQRRRIEHHRAGAVEHEVRVAGGGAVGDHRHRQVGGVGRVVLDLDVEHGGQAAQALRADAQRVDLVEQLEAQFLGAVRRAARLSSWMSIGSISDFLGQQHRLLGGAADADAEHARRAPAGAHRRHGLQHPVDDRVGRIEHRELRLGLANRRPWPRRSRRPCRPARS